jgi:hypothetical protein
MIQTVVVKMLVQSTPSVSPVLLPVPTSNPSSKNGFATSNPTEESSKNNSNNLAAIGIGVGGGVLVVIAAMVF